MVIPVDRLSAETVQSVGGAGVGFRSLAERTDTATAGGTLVYDVFGALARFERDLVRERTLAGRFAARARALVDNGPTVREAAARERRPVVG